MEKNTGIINTDYVSRKATAQIEVECELKADDPISSLLGVTSDAVALTVEALGEEASVTGRVNFKALYLTEDGDIEALDYYSDFKTRIEGEVDATSKLFAFGKVLDTEVLDTSESVVKARAVVEIEIIGVSKRAVTCEEGENFCKKTATVKESVLKEVAEGVFDVGEDFESGERVEKIVLLTTDLVLKEGKPSRGSLLVSGTAIADLAYKTESGIKTLSLSLPFCEELEGENVTPLDDVYLYGYIKDARIVLSGAEDDTDIRVELSVALRVPVFGVEEKEVTVDTYSTECAVEIKREEGECYLKSGNWNYEERLSVSCVLPEEMTSIARIIMIATPSDNVESVTSSSDKTTLLGSFTALLVYEDLDGIVRSYPLDLPYSVTFPTVGSVEEGETYVRSAVCEVTGVAKRSREVEIMYVLKLYAYQCVRKRFTYVSEIREIEEGTSDKKPITIYKKREGEDSWDIAKSLRVPVEDIDGSGEKYVVCYRQLRE
ncbi:MAG: DUF3794 domain-containing protein [Clostridia bacterium]|nr:DUF3794 domain-containing protein [Clostridia bacterium]